VHAPRPGCPGAVSLFRAITGGGNHLHEISSVWHPCFVEYFSKSQIFVPLLFQKKNVFGKITGKTGSNHSILFADEP
jgi:hypothetical protein